MKKLIFIMLFSFPAYAQVIPLPNQQEVALCAYCGLSPTACSDSTWFECQKNDLISKRTHYLEKYIYDLYLVLQVPEYRKLREFNQKNISRMMLQLFEGRFQGNRYCR